MDKSEFLSALRESLEGCIPQDEVEKNISFYRNYFDESEKPDDELVEQLGAPQLIAKTIIDAYRASKGPMADYYTEQARSEYSRQHADGGEEVPRGFSFQFGGSTVADRVIAGVVLFLAAVLLVALAVLAVGVFFRVVLPVLLLLLVIRVLAECFRGGK